MRFDLHTHADPALLRLLQTLSQQVSQLSQLITTTMPTLKEEILQAITAERAQYLAKIEEVLASASNVSEADKGEILTAIRSIVPDTAPAAGRHNVSLGASSTGEETMLISLVNNNVDDDRAALLRSVYDAATAAAAAQAPAGASFASTISITTDGQSESLSIGSEAQKAAADVEICRAFLAQAEAQLTALR